MQGTIMKYPLTLAHILERAGRIFPEQEIISRLPDRSLHRCTYADIYRRARRLAEALQKAGLKRGDRVATLMWNHFAHLETYLGIPVSGGVMHTLNLRLAPREIAYMANHAEDRFLIVDDSLLPLYEQIREAARFERVFVVAFGKNAIPPGTESYEDFLATARGDFAYPQLDENEAATLCYTSGTTGVPKGVAYTHRSVFLHTFLLTTADNFAVSHADVIAPVVSMFHVNGWGFPYAAAMVGAKLVLPGPYLDAESLLELFQKANTTAAAGVPTIWLNVVACLEKHPGRWKLPRMRIIMGGAPLPVTLIRKLQGYGLQVQQGWGLTESSPQATTNQLKAHMKDWPTEKKQEVQSMAGIPVPLVDLRVVHSSAASSSAADPSSEVPRDGNTMGEVQLRGPWVAASYYELPDEKDKWTEDGWFRTGDVGTLDPQGYLAIVDRTKDLIKSGGEWISSVDLENVLVAHPDVSEAAVIAVPHPKWQERPVAFVVAKDGVTISSETLREFMAGKFAKWQLPDAFLFVDQLPHTSTGKLLKAELRERYQDWRWER
jgi:fatty-acyl-CoA synthase